MPGRVRTALVTTARVLVGLGALAVLPGLLGALGGTERAEDAHYERIRAHLRASYDGYADPPGISLAGWFTWGCSIKASGIRADC